MVKVDLKKGSSTFSSGKINRNFIDPSLNNSKFDLMACDS